MAIPFVIANQEHRLRDALNELVAQCVSKPLDIATAYFAISGYRLVKDGLHDVGALRLLLGAEPHAGPDVGLRPNNDAFRKRLQGDLEAEPFSEATLKLVEELIAFLCADKVEARVGPQCRGPGLVSGGRCQESPPHPGSLRWRADRGFRGPGQDLDRQEAA